MPCELPTKCVGMRQAGPPPGGAGRRCHSTTHIFVQLVLHLHLVHVRHRRHGCPGRATNNASGGGAASTVRRRRGANQPAPAGRAGRRACHAPAGTIVPPELRRTPRAPRAQLSASGASAGGWGGLLVAWCPPPATLVSRLCVCVCLRVRGAAPCPVEGLPGASAVSYLCRWGMFAGALWLGQGRRRA